MLQDWIKKSLLEKVESQGKPRSEVNLLEICAADNTTFGVRGSERREKVQEHWQNLKRRSIRSYVAYLERFKVKPSATTLRLLHEQGTQPSPESSISSAETASTETASTETPLTETPSTKTTKDRASQTNPVQFVEQDSPNKQETHIEKAQPVTFPPPAVNSLANSFRNTHLSSPPLVGVPPSRLFSSPILARTIETSTQPIMKVPSLFTSPEAQAEAAPLMNVSVSGYPEGSRNNPYIIHVNVRQPEANREFCIQEVDKILHNNWARKGFHIRTHVGLDDKKYWSASMYRDNPSIEDRAVLIKGRSRPSCYDMTDDYHRKANACYATKTKHRNTTSQIKNDPERFYKHWLLIFPEGLVFDNVIISGDHHDILINSIGVREKNEKHSTNTKFVYWVIALRDGGFPTNGSDQSDEDSDSDFD